MIQSLKSCCKTVHSFIIPVVLVVLVHCSSAWAVDSFATYPQLATGYSSIKVFDNQRRFVGRILPEKRYWVTIDRIPSFLQKAVVAVEDARFYEHGGIDVRGIARALMKDVVKRRFAEGGSTITQQLIKNRYLTGAKTIERKIDEARLAMEFEQKYSKQQILEMYFNEIYYGNGAWGIAQAARLYFDKNPEELSESECALLAGVQKNPSRYNPLGKAEHVTGRRDIVLKRMLDLKMISDRQSKALRANPPPVVKPGQAPQYLGVIRGKLVERYGAEIVELGGLEVTAALDLDLQKLAEQVLREGVRRRSPELQGALVSMDTTTGDVLAAVGGVETSQAGFNRAVAAKRQPGSAIKPLIYAAALELGITAGSLWDDTAVTYNRGNGDSWKPLNYGREKYGELSLRQALAYSNNVITVKLLDAIGVSSFVEYAAKLGLPQRPENGLSLALGTDEVTLSDLVQSYTPLATGGTRSEARFIIRVYDSKRHTWLETPSITATAMSPETAYMTTSILRDVMTYGTAKGLKKFSQDHPSAGKTGTTDDYRDAWFIGYTAQVITGVWVGYDKPRPGGKGFTGGAVAAPLWERYMRKAVSVKPSVDFIKPDSVVSVSIDTATGCPATDKSLKVRDEFFRVGNVPDEFCSKSWGTVLKPLIPVPPLPVEVNQQTEPLNNQRAPAAENGAQ
jgi:1A family penicillin-binding protein